MKQMYTSASGLIFIVMGTMFGCVGCASSAPRSASNVASPSAQWDSSKSDILQRELMSFTDRFDTAVADAFDRLADSTTSYQAKQWALDRKLGHVMGSLINATNESSIVGLMDMLVMVTLIRQTSEDPWFVETFGADSAGLQEVMKAQEADIWQIGQRYLTPAQLAELRDAIERWRREHPDQRYVALVRLSDFAGAKSSSAASTKGRGSIFGLLYMDPLAGLDPAVREVERTREAAQRMFFYLQRMPLLLSWEAESMYRRMISAPQIETFLDHTAKFTDSTLRFADATKNVADAVKAFPPYLTEERQRAVEQVSKELSVERDAAVKQVAQAVSTEREAAIKQLNDAVAAQRDAAIKQLADAVALERNAVLTQATTQVSDVRQATFGQASALLEAQRQGLFQEMESTFSQLLTRLFWLEMIVVASAIALTTLAMMMYRAAGRRRPGTLSVRAKQSSEAGV